ncbi:MAG TPA: GNAT family N-acetyltransferase [Sphingomonadaceae bacterium]
MEQPDERGRPTQRAAIRSARADDCAALARLIAQLGYQASEAEVAKRLAQIQADDRVVLVAEIDRKVVGCLSTSIMRVLHRPKPVGRISMMVVDERRRGQGIGAQLVRAAERALAQQGCGLVEVTSNLARTDAHRFYQRLGYERTSQRFAIDLEGRV